jgi:lipoic acid synthetase
MRQYPDWLKREFSPDGTAREVRSLVSHLDLVTVCESSLCPNLRECYSQRQLTFMILGSRCTRSCRFCAVPAGRPEPADPAEPWRVAEAARRLGLQHIVITSVARDDLRDEGAGHFVAVIDAVRRANPGSSVEVLVPDFHAREELLRRVVEDGRPEVFAHNVETVERLSDRVRPQGDYRRSLRALAAAAALGSGSLIKSSLMVGLGESEAEVAQTLEDLVASGVTHLTIGQYLRPGPGPRHLPVAQYASPEQFQAYERLAREAGLLWVRSGPFVRSSYHAADALKTMREPIQVR